MEYDFQVVVATVGQKDLKKFESMNIGADAIFANQDDRFEYVEKNIDNYTIKMITTNDRGVGKNRNVGLLHSSADILLLADEDMTYVHNLKSGILNAYKEIPDADIIIFSCIFTKNRIEYDRLINKKRKIHLFSSMKYGTYAISARKRALQKEGIYFTELFGPGTGMYCAGEDSLFLRDCFRKRLKVYTHDFIIGECAKDTSSWFEGYNSKYFYDKGAWIACAFPRLKWLIAICMMLRFRGMSELSTKEMSKQIYRGVRGYKQLKKYDEN